MHYCTMPGVNEFGKAQGRRNICINSRSEGEGKIGERPVQSYAPLMSSTVLKIKKARVESRPRLTLFAPPFEMG